MAANHEKQVSDLRRHAVTITPGSSVDRHMQRSRIPWPVRPLRASAGIVRSGEDRCASHAKHALPLVPRNSIVRPFDVMGQAGVRHYPTDALLILVLRYAKRSRV